eukprot:348447-Prorocentrum_minimum.AAC.2
MPQRHEHCTTLLWRAAAARHRTVRPEGFPQVRAMAVLLAGMFVSMGGHFPGAANAASSSDGGCPLPPANFEAIAHLVDRTQCTADPAFDDACEISCVCEMVSVISSTPHPSHYYSMLPYRLISSYECPSRVGAAHTSLPLQQKRLIAVGLLDDCT